jgi:hypothetical protein
MALVTYTRLIVDRVTGNPWFPSPFPPLAKVVAAAKALNDAETAVLTRTRGLAVKRDEARAVLVSLLEQLRAYVEGIANENPEQAQAIIEGAAMDMVTSHRRGVLPFRVKPGRTSGSARIDVKAGPKGSSYRFQKSADGGKTWVDLPATMQANTTVPDLVPGATYLFRYRVVRRKGQGDWSEPLSFVVP